MCRHGFDVWNSKTSASTDTNCKAKESLGKKTDTGMKTAFQTFVSVCGFVCVCGCRHYPSVKEFPPAEWGHAISEDRHTAEPCCPEPEAIANLNRQITVFFYQKKAHLFMCVWDLVCVCVCLFDIPTVSCRWMPAFNSTRAPLNTPWSVAMAFTSPSPSFPSSSLPNNVHRDDCSFIGGESICASVSVFVCMHLLAIILCWKS